MNTAVRRGVLRQVNDRLFRRYGELVCPLEHAGAWQLLVAVILSAQCRDDRVNQVTPELFRRFPDAAAMAAAEPSGVEEVIRPCGLFHAKAASLIRMSQQVAADFHGEVPRTMEELTTLAGVGRKSANVILGNAFGLPGFPVDTHVRRILNLIGAVAERDPVKIEALVDRATPPEIRANLSHMLIQHGRDTCHARKPRCGGCLLADLCAYNRKQTAGQ